MKRILFLTPGGSEIRVAVGEPAPRQDRDAIGVLAVVTHAAGQKRFKVSLDALVPLEDLSLASSPAPEVDNNPYKALALLAVIDRIDSDALALADGDDIGLDVDFDYATRLISRPSLSDRDLRRYLARWVYTVYSHDTLNVRVSFGRIDELITGCDRKALERNVGVLTADGYFTYAREIGSHAIHPTVKLVREVERYGAAKEDAVGERDYAASLRAYPILAPHRDGVVLEWERYSTSRTATELASVFRALVPYVEAILSDVLRSHGSSKSNASLAPMIADLQQRQLGDRALLSKLNHIIVFARDLAAHGASLSESILRIASENAFELIPQIASLAKK